MKKIKFLDSISHFTGLPVSIPVKHGDRPERAVSVKISIGFVRHD